MFYALFIAEGVPQTSQDQSPTAPEFDPYSLHGYRDGVLHTARKSVSSPRSSFCARERTNQEPENRKDA